MKNNENVQWRYIIIFCILAFALFWIPFFAMTLSQSDVNDSNIWKTIFGIIGPFSPLIAAILVRTLISKEGFHDTRLGVGQVRWYFWLVAILFPFFWNTIQDGLIIIFEFSKLDWTQLNKGLYRIPINLFGGLVIFIGEEFGWRSYLLEKLRALGRWKALLLSGAIWSLWHAPLVIIPNVHYGELLSVSGTLLALIIFTLSGFIFGWLYLESKSVWPCVLMHSYNNLISLKLLSEAVTVNSEPTFLQTNLMAIGPIFLVWLVLYLKGEFSGDASWVYDD